MRFPFSLEPGPTEGPADYVSRLATKNRRDDVREFCRDFGLDHQGIVDGRLAAIEELATAADVQSGALYEHTFRRTGEALKYSYRGEIFTRPQIGRDRVRICPACMAEDVQGGEGRLEARPYRRSIWSIDAVRICGIHRCTLVDLPNVGAGALHDTSSRIVTALPKLPSLVANLVMGSPTELEQYVRRRLDGNLVAEWVDALPMYVVINLAPIIGKMEEVDDRSADNRTSEKDRLRREDAGMEVLLGGAVAVRALLDRMMHRFFAARRQVGGRVLFGRLYERLAHETVDAGYEPIRRIIHDHMEATLPVADRDTAFGRSFGDPQVQSVHIAARKHGLHPKRLRKVLESTGLLQTSDGVTSDHRATFAAAAARPLLTRLADSLDLKGVAAHLNIPRPHERALVERNLLRTLTASSEKFRTWSIERREADDFLARMIARADAGRPTKGLCSLPTAASRSCRPSADILELLLDGHLVNVGLDRDARGYMSVLIDPEEVKKLTAPKPEGIVTLREAERRLRTSTKVVTALIDRGHLDARTILNPVTRREQTVVVCAVLVRFETEFVSLQTLAKERNLHFRRVASDLRAKGVTPVDDPALLKVTLYRRSDIA